MAELPSEGELVKQRDFYTLAVDTLLVKGRFKGDAHYLYGPITIAATAKASEPAAGRFALSDYYSFEMAGYEAGVVDESLYKRALLNGRAILLFTFKTPKQQEYPFSYTTCFPSLVNPYSTTGRYFYPHDHGVHPVTKEPFSQPPIPEWHENEPAIVRSDLSGDALVLNMEQDVQIQHLIESLRTV